MTLVGLGLLWRAVNQQTDLSTATFVGSLLLGAGAFNVVEGLIDHHLLGIHHVRLGPHQLVYDAGFLIAGAAVALLGWALIWSGQRQNPVTQSTPSISPLNQADNSKGSPPIDHSREVPN